MTRHVSPRPPSAHGLAEALSPPLADHPFARPGPHDPIQAWLRDLLGERIAAGNVRLAESDGQPVGAYAWTSCPANVWPEEWLDAATLGLPASPYRGVRVVLAGRHPYQPHQRLLLLLLAVRGDRRGHHIDTALLDDWHRQSTDPAARFMVGDRTPLPLNDAAGYHVIGGPIPAVFTGSPVYPLWHAGYDASPHGRSGTAPIAGHPHTCTRRAPHHRHQLA